MVNTQVSDNNMQSISKGNVNMHNNKSYYYGLLYNMAGDASVLFKHSYVRYKGTYSLRLINNVDQCNLFYLDSSRVSVHVCFVPGSAPEPRVVINNSYYQIKWSF